MLCWQVFLVPIILRYKEVVRICGVQLFRKLSISQGLLRVKAFNLLLSDTEARKCGEQKGLETPVVHIVNYVH